MLMARFPLQILAESQPDPRPSIGAAAERVQSVPGQYKGGMPLFISISTKSKWEFFIGF